LSFEIKASWKKAPETSIPRGWPLDADAQLAYRVLKSTLCYSRSVAYACLARSQISQEDRLSGSINSYYSVFHLGVGSLDLVWEHQFELSMEFLFPDSGNMGQIRRARLSQLRHREVIDKLLTLGKYYTYLMQIGKFLTENKELRENFSYGPWTRLDVRVEGHWPITPIRLQAGPVYLTRYARITMDKPAPFTPLRELVDASVAGAEKLIEGYPAFLLESIGKRDRHVNVQIRGAILSALIQAPFFFYPVVPKLVFEEVQSKLKMFLDQLGTKYEEVKQGLIRTWNDSVYTQALESGSILHLDMKLERGTSDRI
jgi:hypothetical protein